MWKETEKEMSRTFKFDDFTQAWSFMTQVAMHAEKQNHHPEWSNVYNTVNITLSTHDAGNVVTDKDKKLANTIDGIYEKYN